MADNELQLRITATADQLAQTFATASAQAKDFASQIGQLSGQMSGGFTAAKTAGSSMADELIGKLGAIAASIITVHEAIAMLKAGINFADEIRDLSSSLNALQRDVGGGEQALAKFRAVADQTRYTAEELASAFRDALPAAIRRGISDATLSSLTVQMAKIAPLLGQSLQDTMSQLEAIMSGRGRLYRSPLLNMLLSGTGFTAEDITKGLVPFQEIWTAMLPNIDALAAKGEAMGQTFQSVFAKIKESMFDAFAEGFAGGEKSYQALLDAFRDPALIEAIKDIGKAIADWLPTAIKVVGGIVQLLADLPKNIKGLATPTPGSPGADILEFLRFVGGQPEEASFFAPGGSTAAQAQWQAQQIARLRQIQDYQRTFGRFAQAGTGALGLGMFGPAIPTNIQQYLGGPGAAAAVASTLVAGTKDQTKDLRDTTEAAKDLDAELAVIEDRIARAFRAPDLDPLQAKLTAARDRAHQLSDEIARVAAEWDKTDPEKAGILLQLIQKDIPEALRRQEEALLSDAWIEYWDKAGQAARKYADEVEKIRQGVTLSLSLKVPSTVSGPIQAQAEDLATIYAAALSSPDVRNAMDTSVEEAQKQIVAGYKEAARILEDSGLKVASSLAKAGEEFAKRVIDPLTNAFADLATTGGANLGRVMAQAFQATVAAGAGDLVNSMFGIGKTTTAEGKTVYTYGGQQYGSLQLAQGAFAKANPNLYAGVTGGMSAIGAGVTGYTTGAGDLANAAGALTSAAGLVATMAALYGSLAAIPVVGWIAAGAVAVGQVIGKLLQPSPGASYQYATGVGFNAGGQFVGTPNQNIDKNTWSQMQASAQQAFDDTWNGFYKILMKFPGSIADVSKTLMAVYGMFEQGADLGKAASEKFMQEFQAWVSQGMPKELGAKFFPLLSDAFQTLGVTADAFQSTWDQLMKLDPKTLQATLLAWADALQMVQEALTNIARPTGFGPQTLESAFGFGGSVLGQIGATGMQNYGQQLAELDKKILDFGNGLKGIVGPELITDEQQLAQMVADRYAKEKQMVQDLLSAIVAGARSAQNAIDNWKLAEMGLPGGGGPQAQVDYLKKRADLYQQLALSATDPAIAKQAHDDFLNTVNQIAQIGAAQGPEAAKAYYDWAISAAQSFENEYETHLRALGASMDAENAQFLAQFQPIYNTFLQGLGGAGTAASTMTTSLDGATAALDQFTPAVVAATAALASIGGANVGDGGFSARTAAAR